MGLHDSLVSFFEMQRFRIYHGRWIDRGGPVSWPERSPDLILWFFLWEQLELLVYAVDNPDEATLRRRIMAGWGTIQHNLGIIWKRVTIHDSTSACLSRNERMTFRALVMGLCVEHHLTSWHIVSLLTLNKEKTTDFGPYVHVNNFSYFSIGNPSQSL